ncbi:DUF6531 domain-containing protein [Pasteurella bettyae]|uniref:DUF6531 domain-containing protein n=1 Tax=Pasteurella bettyae TaxID=752 RepID=UPI001E49FFF7|nr:DUF6531 domain-containing protein [Pasteurella bettyae]
MDVLTGQLVEQRVDFTLGQTIPLSFIRTWSRYKDEQQSEGLCGRFWTDNFSEYADISDNGQHIKIATFEGTYLRFALPQGSTGSFNPDHPEYTLIRHREYLELFNRDTQLSKLFYFIKTPETNDSIVDEEIESKSDLTYPPLTDGRYLISAWLDTFDNAIQFHYNEHSWLEAVSHTDGISLTFTYQGDWLHQIIRTDTQQPEVLATYTQDARGALIESDALLDFRLFYHYDEQFNLTLWTDNDKTRVDYHYDEKGRVIHSIGADGFYPVWFQYEDNQTTVLDSHQRATVYDYDSHKLTHIVRPNQSEEKQHYDRHGNLIRYTDANGVDWQLKYGAFDLLTEKVDGEGNRWQYDYDKDSLKLSQVTNPKGETYRYVFNENGQVLEEIDFTDNRWLYSYNENGTLRTLTDGEGNVTHYEYDNAYHLIRLMTVDDNFLYTYDKIGRVTHIQSIYQHLSFEYDLKDRIIKETQNYGEIYRAYDDENQTVTRTLFIKDEHGHLNTISPIITIFKYNQVGELVQLDLPAQETSGQKQQLFCKYDSNGNEIQRISNQGFILNQRFDEMDCLIQQRADWEPEQFFDKDELRATGIDAPSFAEVSQRYQYDKALNTTATQAKSEKCTFHLNRNNQITAVYNQNGQQERYAYDECGYLTQQAQGVTLGRGSTEDERLIQHQDIYQKGHKLNRINNDYYTYDKTGRLTKKTEIRDGFRQKTTYYRWNACNKLTSITNNNGEVWYYQYDALGRRISKACPQQRPKITYLWDGDQLAYTQTFKNGKLESQRHSIFNGW